MSRVRRSAAECGTLAEYREWVLRESQQDVALRAKCKQSWISAVERGHLPRPKNWVPLLRAYQVGEDDFVRMVETARLHAQLQQTPEQVREQYPLFAAGAGDVGQAPVVLAPQPGGKAKGA